MSDLPQKSQFLIYQAEDGVIKIDVRFEEETVWLTQQHMAELMPEATHKEFLSVRREGGRDGFRISAPPSAAFTRRYHHCQELPERTGIGRAEQPG